MAWQMTSPAAITTIEVAAALGSAILTQVYTLICTAAYPLYCGTYAGTCCFMLLKLAYSNSRVDAAIILNISSLSQYNRSITICFKACEKLLQ
jgi:hypothetical protein